MKKYTRRQWIIVALIFLVLIFYGLYFVSTFINKQNEYEQCALRPGTGNCGDPSTLIDVEKVCTASGGVVKVVSCCKSSSDFPNTCLIGVCGCSTENSHEVKICDCGENKCWDNTYYECVNNPNK
jgi:hypothetical protein